MRACFTTRAGGVSAKPWNSFNLATRVGDAPHHVARNRALLSAALKLPQGPLWLRQEHGNRVVDAAQGTVDIVADGAVTHGPSAVCAVLVADCVPILLCNRSGDHVGAAHAGWRGIEGGVIEQAVAAMPAPPACLLTCYLLACLPACLLTCYLLACLPACLLACLPACLLACLPACLLACLPGLGPP